MLRMNKLILLIAWGITCFLFYGVAAHADEWDQSTKMTFSQPIQIPGRTLPAGTYLFKLANTNDRSLVEIFNADGTELYATAMTIATERKGPADNTVVTLAQQNPGTPDALLKWFYPGEVTGHEFVYPKQEEQQLAQERQQTVTANAPAESGD